ncbi:MAG: hypothetical protein R2757_07090 [Draconibacterium sp.]
MKQFIFKILTVSIVLALIGWVVFSFFLKEYYLPVLPFMLLFFMIVTISVHAWQLRMAKKDIAKFTRSNMLLTFVKLVIYSVFAVVYIAFESENALVFVICLFGIYLVFSIIEVSDLTRISKKK